MISVWSCNPDYSIQFFVNHFSAFSIYPFWPNGKKWFLQVEMEGESPVLVSTRARERLKCMFPRRRTVNKKHDGVAEY